jgi:subtilisin family serine protease
MDWRGPFPTRPSSLRARPPARSRAARPLPGPEPLEQRQLLAGDVVALPAPSGDGLSPAAAEILPAAIPNDPSFAVEWGLQNTGQYAGTPGNDIGAPQAWEFTTGSRSVVVAVIDSGIDLTHPDLVANLWVNPGEIAGDGIDNDGNGFVDDIHGWDFVDNDALPQDGFGHGTHVAGIIGATGNNGVGVTGVNWQVSIMALRIQDDRGAGSTSAMLAAVRYATMMRRDHGIMIVASNNSWDAPAGYSGVVEQAIREHGEAGITFVAAAGNNATNTDVSPKYPGGYDLPNVITVASLTPQGGLAASSNYGATSVDVAAPGTVIQSTYKNGTYGTLSGTSMAAPHVTGVVALLAAAKPGLTVTQTRAAILGTATPLPALAGKVATGRLNAFAALGSLGLAPTAPPVALPPAPPPPVPPALGVAFPFSDEFEVANGPLRSPNWTVRAGAPAIQAGGLVAGSSVPAVVTVRGFSGADVSLRSLVDVRFGGRVGLVARDDPATGRKVVAEIFTVGSRFRARIMVGDASGWQVFAAGWMPAGRGILRLDVTGDRLQLFFKGRAMLEARAGLAFGAIAIPPTGEVGLRIVGARPRAESFAAFLPR